MNTELHFSSVYPDWGTPQDFYDKLDARFHFTLDVCATAQNAKCKAYITPERDALSARWSGICWMNPPYGRQIGKWVHKAHLESQLGATVVCLLPARTDTRWFHDVVLPYAARVEFLKGRLKFEGANGPAPFPSMIAVFSRSMERLAFGQIANALSL